MSAVPRGTSGYQGVSREGNKWRATLCLRGRRQKRLGVFSTPEEAAKAYVAAREAYERGLSQHQSKRA